MSRLKVHLSTGTAGLPACGTGSARTTRNLNNVTCEGCKRTVAMADAEIIQQQNRRRSNA